MEGGMIVLGGCAGNSGEQNNGAYFNEESHSEIEELVKAQTIEDANKLIKEGYVFIAVYWNSAKSSEEYVLGKINRKKVSGKRIGFLPR